MRFRKVVVCFGLLTVLLQHGRVLALGVRDNMAYVNEVMPRLSLIDTLAYPRCDPEASEYPPSDAGEKLSGDAILRAWVSLYKGDCAKVLESPLGSSFRGQRLRAMALAGLGRTREASLIYRELGAETHLRLLASKAKAEGHRDYTHWLALAFLASPDRLVANELAEAYRESGQQELALSVWRTLGNAVSVDRSDHWWAIGEIEQSQGNLQMAVSAYQKGAVLASGPDSYLYWIRSGDIHQQIGDLSEAEAAYLRALQARPDVDGPYVRLGTAALAKRDYSSAMEWFQKAMEVAPQSSSALLGMGRVHFDQSDYLAAVDYFERADELDSTDVWPDYYLALCYYDLEGRAEASFYIQSIFEHFSDKPWPWAIRVAVWAEKKGETDWAKLAYQKALEWNPLDESLRAKVEMLRQ